MTAVDEHAIEVAIDPIPLGATLGSSLRLVITADWSTPDGRTLADDVVVEYRVPEWLPVGTAITEVTAQTVEVAVGETGAPLLVWDDGAALEVRTWTGAAWDSAAGRSWLGNGTTPAVASRGDTFAVAWRTDAGLRTSLLSPSGWTDEVPPAEADALAPALAFDRNGDLWLSYNAAVGAERFGRVLQRTSETWANRWSLSARADSSTHTFEGAIAVRDGEALVAFAEKQANPSNVREVGAFAGTTTASQQGDLLRKASAQSQARSPSVAIGEEGERWIAWSEQWDSGNAHGAFAVRWNVANGEWEATSALDLLPGAPRDAQIVVAGSQPIAAWLEGDAFGTLRLVVAWWDGAAWHSLGVLDASGADAHCLTLDPHGNPVLAWIEKDAIRVARLNR